MGVGELRWRGVRGFLQSRFRGIFAVSDTFSGRDAILKLPTWISWPKPFEQKKSRPKILSNSVARVDWSRRSHFESQNVTSLIVTSMTLTAVDCTLLWHWTLLWQRNFYLLSYCFSVRELQMQIAPRSERVRTWNFDCFQFTADALVFWYRL